MAVLPDQSHARPVGQLLRSWRERRRLSQLELSHSVDVSTRHLSYLETGRAQPSRAMVLRLAEHLDVPLRDRNRLLLSAGFAPVYSEAGLHSPQLVAVRAALRGLLTGHEPRPGLVVDRWWNLVEANAPVHRMLATVDPELLRPPVNPVAAARQAAHDAGHGYVPGASCPRDSAGRRGAITSLTRGWPHVSSRPPGSDLVSWCSTSGPAPVH